MNLDPANLAAVANRMRTLRDRLPAELRMGTEAAEALRAVGRPRARPPAWLPDWSWVLDVPVRVDENLPVNAWIMVDGRGRAMQAGVMNGPTEAGGG